MVTIMPQPYVGQGLLGDDERNNILGTFAGGLLQGFTVNPTPVMGQYFTPLGGGNPVAPDGTQTTMLTPEAFARMMQDYRNTQNLLNEGDPADDIGPPEADPGTFDGSLKDFITSPQGLLSIFDAPFGPIGLIRGAMRNYDDYQLAQDVAYDTEADDRDLAAGFDADMGDFEY